ncbi:MAG: hypothetical protein ACRDRF_06690, partial [Pseudonocardiaceae bacterium]
QHQRQSHPLCATVGPVLPGAPAQHRESGEGVEELSCQLDDLCWGTLGSRDVANHYERRTSDDMETRTSGAVSPP